jgi:hypothetical protein
MPPACANARQRHGRLAARSSAEASSSMEVGVEAEGEAWPAYGELYGGASSC